VTSFPPFSAAPHKRVLRPLLAVLFSLLAPAISRGDDGYRLWLRHDPLPAEAAAPFGQRIASLVAPDGNATREATRRELVLGLSSLFGRGFASSAEIGDGALVVGTPGSSKPIAALNLGAELSPLGAEGFLIRPATIDGRSVTVIAASTDLGALYGAFHLLRLVQTRPSPDAVEATEKPRFALRLLNHWDNLDGSIERGYAGRSLWNWDELPDATDPRLVDYARANASLGINGTVLNNVNASAQSLAPDYLRKTAAIADVFRPYGLRVYLSARFSAPIELGGLPSADPLDADVAAWWRAKADDIYALIPDFGGFLVKANSEGQPGPLTYKRTHADGANMLAAALAPHRGVVMWRAFVYEPEFGSDRIGQSYNALKPFDGKFAPNVLVQVKNGPLDFMPREPFHPLFGGMEKTQVMPELQITQEYLGHSRQLAFLAPMWREFLDADTCARGPGSTVLRSVDGSIFNQRITGIAGVANTGSDRNWTGHPLAQANWYAFGRLAWNPVLGSDQIAREWTRQTLTRAHPAVDTVARLLLESREAVVDYSMPLGLHHQMRNPHHYGPQPWLTEMPRADWTATYFHRAAADGIGFDRSATGSNTVAQYHPGVRERFADLATCPEELLLWFHRVPWDHRMRSGRPLWDELCLRYQRGVDWVRATRKEWAGLAGSIDPALHAAVTKKLAIQETDAEVWRDASLLYFQTFSKRPFPEGMDAPQRTLDELKATDPLRWAQ
jgi:alpha-glucuronidase